MLLYPLANMNLWNLNEHFYSGKSKENQELTEIQSPSWLTQKGTLFSIIPVHAWENEWMCLLDDTSVTLLIKVAHPPQNGNE